MLSAALNRILKKIHLQDSSCEKKRVGRTHEIEGETAREQRTQQPLVGMGPVGDRTKDEKNGGIPDPWFS